MVKNIKKYEKKIYIILILILAFCGMTGSVCAEEVDITYSATYMKWLNLSDEEKQDLIVPSMTVKNISNTYENLGAEKLITRLKTATKYSLKDRIEIRQEDQGKTGLCWGFATTTALESNVAITKDIDIQYSPRHIEYATARTFLDGTNDVVFNRNVNDGGNNEIASAYLTSGMGPVLESDMPFIESIAKIYLSELRSKKPCASLKEYIRFPNIIKERINGSITYSNGGYASDYKEYSYSQVSQIRDKIKEHITKYGGIVAIISFHREFFSKNYESFICTNTNYYPNHAVTIIGWDDNYPIEKFRNGSRPSSPGAWLVQDSHGDITPPYYISYEDVWIEYDLLGFIDVGEIDYDNIYQHDYMGANINFAFDMNTASAINVFERKSEKEYLTEISLYTVGNEEYEIFVNPTDGSIDESKFKKIKSIGKTDSDYITVKLDKPMELTGNKFAIMVKYISQDKDVLIPVEAYTSKDSFYKFCSSNSGESFYIANKTDDMKKLSYMGFKDANACIKAFTKFEIEPKFSILTSDKYKIMSSEYKIKNIMPDTTLQEFENNISLDVDYQIVDKDDKIITDKQDLIKTGTSIVTKLDEKYKIIVKGDTNGDGTISGTDIIMIKKHLLEIEYLEKDYEIAGDVNDNNETTATDLLNIKQYICDIAEL